MTGEVANIKKFFKLSEEAKGFGLELKIEDSTNSPFFIVGFKDPDKKLGFDSLHSVQQFLFGYKEGFFNN